MISASCSRRKGDRTGETHFGLVRIFIIPDLAILHVKSQRAEHRFAVPCQRVLAISTIPAGKQGKYTMHKLVLIRHGESA